ncbi:hypothetical protein llap_12729 [Limosa lapponica baueri]|uniref:Uncharacterized protein n=1 Tax=Limosa lapponica baueri TaxID=1758121 RepID=A0A2I0TT65_LIMLA|nr:hypothetical protein llap_12729 [Limosa lapponica baueri]
MLGKTLEQMAKPFVNVWIIREMGLMKKGEAVKVITSIRLELTKGFDPGSYSDMLITKVEKYELDKITLKRLLRWLRQCAQRAVIQGLLSDSEDASSETLQLSVLVFF